MTPVSQAFARTMGTLQPLIPKPEPVDPEPDMPIDMEGLNPAPPPPLAFAAPKKASLAPFDPSTASPQDVAMRPALSRLQQDEEKDLHPWGTDENHPGFWGKLGHAVSVATGGPNRRKYEEMGLADNLRQMLGEQSKEGLEAAQTSEAQTRAKAGEPHEVSPQLAAALGTPELEGQMLPASAIATLEKQHGINTTKANTTTQTNTTREEIAKGANQTKLSVAEITQMGKTQPHITTMVGGQPHIMERDPNTKEYSIDRGIAPPNFAMIAPEIKTYQTQDDQGQDVTKTLSGQTLGLLPHTSTMRNMSEMASTILPMVDSVSQEVQQMASSLGPAVGRWNQLMVNKGGTDFPEFAGLDTDLDLLASAIVRTHFGARGGQQYREELRKMFGEAQTPEDLLNRIQHADTWIMGYAQAGGAKAKEGGVPQQHGAGERSGGGISGPPEGADVKVPGKDGKMYWGNSKTKQIYGEAQ